MLSLDFLTNADYRNNNVLIQLLAEKRHSRFDD